MAADGGSILDDLYDLYKAGKAGVQSAASGAATGAANVGEMFGRAANIATGSQVFDGTADTARNVAGTLAADADATRAGISARGQQARADSNVSGNLLKGEVDFGRDPSLRGYALNIAEGLGSLAPTVATAIATRGRSLETQAGVNAGVGAVTGGGFAAQAEGQHVREMDAKHLAALPAYQQGIAAGLTPDAARESAARKAETGAFLATAPVSGLGDAATGALFGHTVQGALAKAVGGGKLAHVAASGLVDAAKEGVQETAEGVTQIAGATANTGEQGRDLGEGSAQNFVMGAATGLPTGGGAALLDQHVSHETPPTAPGPGSPQSQPAATAPAPAVVDPSRGVLSRAVAAGAAEGHLPHVQVVGRDFLGAAGDGGMLPDTQPLLQPHEAPGISAEAAQFAPHAQLMASAAAADKGMPYVNAAAGATITPAKGLSPRERLVEARAAQQVLSDPDAAVAAYDALPDTDGGRFIGADEAKELFADYNAGPQARTDFSVAIHEPSSWLTKEVYKRRLEQPVAEDRDPTVVFTAGGTGAGKTTGIRKNSEASAIRDNADLVYDGNLAGFDSAVQKIEQAKESGRMAHILYVHRDPVDAFARGVIPRASREDYGRSVHTDSHAKTHIGAATTILQLAHHYANDPMVQVSLVNNSGDTVTPLEQQIAGVANIGHTELKETLDAKAQQLHAEGKLNPRLQAFYGLAADGSADQGQPGAQSGPAGSAQPGSGSAPGADGAGQPAGGGAGQSGDLTGRAVALKLGGEIDPALLQKHGLSVEHEFRGTMDSRRLAEFDGATAGPALYQRLKAGVGLPSHQAIVRGAPAQLAAARAELAQHGVELGTDNARQVEVMKALPKISATNPLTHDAHQYLWNALTQIAPDTRFSGSMYADTATTNKADDLDYFMLSDNVDADAAKVAALPGVTLDKEGTDPKSGARYLKFEYEWKGGKADIAVVPREHYAKNISSSVLTAVMPKEFREQLRADKQAAYDKVLAAKAAHGKGSLEYAGAKAVYEAIKAKATAEVNRTFQGPVDALGSKAPSYNGRDLHEVAQSYGVIVAPKPGTKIAVDGVVRPYQRGTDTTLPPAAAPVQRAPDLAVLQERAGAILKRPAALAALRKAFGIKNLQAATIRGSYEGEPELSFQLRADGLDAHNSAAVAQFLGMAFAQDAVIVTKPDPLGPDEDSIPTIDLSSTDGAKIDPAVFDAVTAELRGQGIDYSEARDGRAIRVLHFGDDAGFEELAVAMTAAASAHGLGADLLHTRSDLYEAQDYRRNLQEGGPAGSAGQRSALFGALIDHFVGPYARALGAVGYGFDADRYADRFGLEPAERDQLKAALKAEPRPSTGLLDGSEPLPARQGRATNIDAGYFLQNRAAQFGTIDANDRSPHAKDVISETFAQEITHQLNKPEGKQAIGWYDRQLKAALGTIAEVHPEIASDPNSAFVFKSVLAVTSQGLTVEQNFNAALKAYERYKATGKLDLAGVTLPGKAAPLAKQNIEKVQQLIDQRGVDGAREYMTSMHTVRELKAAGFEPAGKLGDKVRGYFVFGPKIGSFANNLDGDFNTLTADLWFSRTWNRALGAMFQYSPQREVEALRKFRGALVEALNTPGSNAVVDALGPADRAKIGNLDDDLALAKRMHQQFARDGYKDRSPLNRAAKALTENIEGLRDVPRGDPERRWQQEVMEETQRKLEQRTGQRISIADLQALLWYQEKELFRTLGAANKASAPLDYQDAAKAAVARVRGAGLASRDDAHIVQTAFPIGTDSLLQKLRRIATGARLIPLAGTGKATSRLAISPALDEAQAAKVAALPGVRSVYPGATPSETTELPDGSTPARFQVPAAVAAHRDYAVLDHAQQKTVDAALDSLKQQGYPARWLKAASYFFGHAAGQDFVAKFYIGGEAKGAVSIRADRLGDARKVARDLAHELAHANDFNPETGGLHSVMSPRLRIEFWPDGRFRYTGDVISELYNAWDDDTALAEELNYPFGEAEAMGDDITKAEVFAQAVMLYMTHREALKREAPKTHAMIEEMFRNEHAATDHGFGALQGALQTTRSREVFAGAVRSQDQRAGGELDRGEPDRPAAAGADDRSGAGREPDRGQVALGARDKNAPASKFLADVESQTMENPFSGRERVFTSPDNSVYYGSAELHSFPSEPKTVWINGIRSFEQGKGYGSYLLGKLTDLADEHGVTLRLTAEPFGQTKALGKQKLVAWYKRHGFKGPASQMERAPVTPESPEYLGSRAPGTPPPAEAFAGYTLPSWQLGDHLSSEAGKRLEGYKAAAAAGGDKLRTFLQDYFLPVRRVQEAIQSRGGTVSEDSDVYGREELYYGRTGERLRKIEDDHVKPLVKALVASGVKQSDLELYLYAKFAPERNARIAEINPALPDGGSGMTNADAAQVLADFAKDGQTAKLEALAQRVRALNAQRINILEEGGLLSPGEAELWRAEPDYVPLKGFAEGVGKPGETRVPTGQGFSIGGREAHRALGRKSRATDLLANTIAQVEQAVIRAEKNRVATALLRLAEENPNPDLWTVDVLPRQAVLSPSGEVSYRDNPLHKLADNVVSVKIAGNEHFITLKDERLAGSLKNLGAAKMGAFLRAFSAINRTLSLTRTMLAPEFVLANFSRDLQTAAVNLTGEESAAMAARVVKDVPAAMKAMWAQLRGKQVDGEWGRVAQEFADAGGMTAFVAQRTVEEQQAHINGLLKDAKGGKKAAIKALVKGTFELIENINGAVENATRLSAYAAARRNGKSAEQAARLAKNLTVNFNRKGSAGPVINALYLFYNASIQGTARFLHAMKSPKVQGIMAATAMLGFGLAAANRAIGGKDDDGEDKWDKIPEWEKARNLILFLPGGNGKMVKIPLPYTYNLPFLIGGETEGMLNSKRPATTSAANIASAALTSFNPIGDIDLTEDAANTAAKLVSPTATDPLVEIALNRNFFGAPINPEKSPFDKTPDPDSQSAFPSTSPAAKWIANALNTATGGDKLHPGLIDVGPGSLVYVFDYLTGGTGSFVERATTAATLAAQGEDVPANKIPFYRTFAGELSDRRVTDTFYRVRDDVNLKAEMAQLHRKGEGFDSPGERRDALFGQRMSTRLKATERQLASVRKLRRKAQADGDDAKTKALEERERNIQLNFNKAYFHALDAQDEHG